LPPLPPPPPPPPPFVTYFVVVVVVRQLLRRFFFIFIVVVVVVARKSQTKNFGVATSLRRHTPTALCLNSALPLPSLAVTHHFQVSLRPSLLQPTTLTHSPHHPSPITLEP